MASNEELLAKLEENLRARDTPGLLDDLERRKFVPEAAEIVLRIVKERGITMPTRMSDEERSRHQKNLYTGMVVVFSLIGGVFYVLIHVFSTTHPLVLVKHTAFATAIFIAVIVPLMRVGDHSK